jgi:hypothetical protein
VRANAALEVMSFACAPGACKRAHHPSHHPQYTTNNNNNAANQIVTQQQQQQQQQQLLLLRYPAQAAAGFARAPPASLQQQGLQERHVDPPSHDLEHTAATT